MNPIEKRLLRAWKEKRGMRLSAEEVELLMQRGLKYLNAESQGGIPAAVHPLSAPDPPQIDSSTAQPLPSDHRGPGR